MAGETARFTDATGRDWLVEITVDTVRQVRKELDVDLMQAAGGDVLERLAADPVELVDVLFVICRDQAEERGLSDVDFGRSLAGDAIEAATDALIDSIVAFFPPRLRKHLEAIRERQTETLAALDKQVTEKVTGEKFSRALKEIVSSAGAAMDAEIAKATTKAKRKLTEMTATDGS